MSTHRIVFKINVNLSENIFLLGLGTSFVGQPTIITYNLVVHLPTKIWKVH